ncbi:hypothetical protein NL30_37130 [Burkholderia contaminans]|uniref:IpaC/SipC family type III secretion system effector n=1 Tax=Burkholderia contaminans TaxID=488447 RepID=UPI000649731F|nr:IpaC/SipC family type III secretion system effector [Burkholderia contaminans]AKM45439.1 hypothetical protein NL30_37130 [Burkholderia contaminans]
MAEINMLIASSVSEFIPLDHVDRAAGSRKPADARAIQPSNGERIAPHVDPEVRTTSMTDLVRLLKHDLELLEPQRRDRMLVALHADTERLNDELDTLEQQFPLATRDRRAGAVERDPRDVPGGPDGGDEAEPEAPKGDSFSRLTDLLTRALMLLGKMSSERNAAGMKMAVLSSEHARKAGDKIVESARHNLGGAIAGAAVGLIATGAGTRQVMKSQTRQIKNLKFNDKEAMTLRDDARAIRKSIAQADAHELQADRLRSVGGDRRSATLQSSERNLTRAERGTLEAQANEMDQRALELEHLSKEVPLQQQRKTVVGQAISSMAQPSAGIAQSGAGVAAAAATGQVKVEDSSSAIASSMQQSLVQSAARTEESVKALLSKLEQLMSGRQSLVLGMLRA